MDLLRIAEMLLLIVCGAALSNMVIPKISLVSFRRRLFDSVDARKLHTAPIPRLGGISFFPCITLTFSLAVVFYNLRTGSNALDYHQTTRLLAMFCAMMMLFLIGMMDDLISVRYKSKFIMQTFAASILVASGYCLNNFYGLFGIHEIPLWVGVPFSIVMFVYIMNAINLIDGIDGLASGLSGIALFAFGCIFLHLKWWFYASLSFTAFGVLVPFFFYNVFGNVNRGRKIFMGDTGSLTIGLILGIQAIRLSMVDAEQGFAFPGAIVVAFSFIIVPLLDVVRVVIHRLREGHSPFMPDRNHIHHKFIDLGLTQRQAMLTIVGIAILFAVCNSILIHYLSTTLLFLTDIVVWTVMHILLSRQIKQRKVLREQSLSTK